MNTVQLDSFDVHIMVLIGCEPKSPVSLKLANNLKGQAKKIARALVLSRTGKLTKQESDKLNKEERECVDEFKKQCEARDQEHAFYLKYTKSN